MNLSLIFIIFLPRSELCSTAGVDLLESCLYYNSNSTAVIISYPQAVIIIIFDKPAV